MNRRGFLSSCLALAAAPAIVRADSLMRIVPREAVVLVEDCTMALDEYVVTATTGNAYVTISEITAEALRVAHRDMIIGTLHGAFSDAFKVGDRFTMVRGKHGDTIRVRLPERE